VSPSNNSNNNNNNNNSQISVVVYKSIDCLIDNVLWRRSKRASQYETKALQ